MALSKNLERLRVLLMCNGNLIAGGAERMVSNLSRYFVERNIQTHCAFPKTSGDWQGFLEWFDREGLKPGIAEANEGIYVPQSAREGKQDFVHIRRLASRTKPTVVNLHACTEYISLRDVIAIRMGAPGARLVCSIHSFSTWDRIGGHKKKMTRLAARFCHSVVANSNKTKEMLEQAGIPASKVKVIYCGVRQPESLPDRCASRQVFRVPNDAFVISIASRLYERKGAGFLMSALEKMDFGEQPVHLLIAGDGPEYDNLVRQAQGLRCSYRFLGRISNMNELYAASDVFVLPSYDEAFGLVYVEAGFYSVPSIGLNDGGVPEVVKDGESGIVVAPKDTEALSNALRLLYRDPARRARMGKVARQRSIELFTDQVMGEGYLNEYGFASRLGRLPTCAGNEPKME